MRTGRKETSDVAQLGERRNVEHVDESGRCPPTTQAYVGSPPDDAKSRHLAQPQNKRMAVEVLRQQRDGARHRATECRSAIPDGTNPASPASKQSRVNVAEVPWVGSDGEHR